MLNEIKNLKAKALAMVADWQDEALVFATSLAGSMALWGNSHVGWKAYALSAVITAAKRVWASAPKAA